MKANRICHHNRLVITSTLFQQPSRRLYTWTCPDGQYQDQIDNIICCQRWRSYVQSAKTRPGADCGSDHKLLIAKFRLKLKIIPKTTRPFRVTNEEDATNEDAKSVLKQNEKEKPEANIPSIVSSVPGGSGMTKEVGETSQEEKSVFKQDKKDKPQANVPSVVPSLPAGSGSEKCDLEKKKDCNN